MSGKSEAVIMKEVMLEATKLGMRVFRNNRGQFYTMDSVRKLMALIFKGDIRGAIEYFKNCMRIVRAGLSANGSSDLVGWDKNGKFCAIEVKSGRGRPSKEQLNFIEQVNKSGGFGCIVKNVEELKEKYCAYCVGGVW